MVTLNLTRVSKQRLFDINRWEGPWVIQIPNTNLICLSCLGQKIKNGDNWWLLLMLICLCWKNSNQLIYFCDH